MESKSNLGENSSPTFVDLKHSKTEAGVVLSGVGASKPEKRAAPSRPLRSPWAWIRVVLHRFFDELRTTTTTTTMTTTTKLGFVVAVVDSYASTGDWEESAKQAEGREEATSICSDFVNDFYVDIDDFASKIIMTESEAKEEITMAEAAKKTSTLSEALISFIDASTPNFRQNSPSKRRRLSREKDFPGASSHGHNSSEGAAAAAAAAPASDSKSSSFPSKLSSRSKLLRKRRSFPLKKNSLSADDLDSLSRPETVQRSVNGSTPLAVDPPGDAGYVFVDGVVKRFLCRQCDRIFARSDSYKRHVRSAHGVADSAGKKFVCLICGLSSPRVDNVRKHLRGVHELGPSVALDDFVIEAPLHRADPVTPPSSPPPPSSSPALLFVSAETRRFVCRVCRKDFVSTQALKRHERTLHATQRRRFPCKLCDAFFARVDGVKKHERKYHSGERSLGSQAGSWRKEGSPEISERLKNHAESLKNEVKLIENHAGSMKKISESLKNNFESIPNSAGSLKSNAGSLEISAGPLKKALQ